MKVVAPGTMQYLESEAYRDGASASDFMEEAGSGVALVVHDFAERYQIDRNVTLLCGKGNNAGDAYVAGLYLLNLEYIVHAVQIPPMQDCSELVKRNAERFAKEGGQIKEYTTVEELNFPDQGIIVDGIFGTGFRGDVGEPYSSVIKAANDSGLIILSLDIPSGLNGETGEASSFTITAAETAYLGLPKTGFFLNDGWDHVGYLRYVDFGLPTEYIDEVHSDFNLMTPDIVIPLLPKVRRSRHKYEAGLVTGIAGSPGMPGAALLSSLASLRGGAGITKLWLPKSMQAISAAEPFEVVKIFYDYANPGQIIEEINKGSSCYIGPGLGQSKEVFNLLREIIPEIKIPCVLDADALNFLAENPVKLPPQTILTPHRGEFARLNKMENFTKVNKEVLKICQAYAEENDVTLVLKGAPTFIFHPRETIWASSMGDPGMATAGTGDVLTGLIAALLAQKTTPFDAARLGVFLHGLAGEHAVQEKTPYCTVASDLIDFLPAAFAFEPS